MLQVFIQSVTGRRSDPYNSLGPCDIENRGVSRLDAQVIGGIFQSWGYVSTGDQIYEISLTDELNEIITRYVNPTETPNA